MTRQGVLACVLLGSALVSGCALPYYWQAMTGQIDLQRRAAPIASVVDDPAQADELRAALRGVQEMRRFAVTALALPDNESYTRYADLERGYAVWNVVATEPFSVDPVEWCFPFAGCVTYRGYFDRADAERFERRLIERGLDTYTGGAAAYSTLGYFDDPVLSTMLGRPEADIAGMLFHELAHQKVYVQDDTELSEAFATVVEEYGVETWLRERGMGNALAAYAQRRARGADFSALVARQRERLRAVFAADLPVDDLQDAKDEAFARMRAEYAALVASWGGATEYDAWFAALTNNAALAAFAAYRRWVPALERRLDEVGLAQFYADVGELEGAESAARVATLESWALGPLAAGRAAQLREVGELAR